MNYKVQPKLLLTVYGSSAPDHAKQEVHTLRFEHPGPLTRAIEKAAKSLSTAGENLIDLEDDTGFCVQDFDVHELEVTHADNSPSWEADKTWDALAAQAKQNGSDFSDPDNIKRAAIPERVDPMSKEEKEAIKKAAREIPSVKGVRGRSGRHVEQIHDPED